MSMFSPFPTILVQWLKPSWKVGDRRFEPRSVIKFQTNKKILPRSLAMIIYCGEPLGPRGSMLGLRRQGLVSNS